MVVDESAIGEEVKSCVLHCFNGGTTWLNVNGEVNQGSGEEENCRG